jgi:holo-[acyl-carrier protein] synthase
MPSGIGVDILAIDRMRRELARPDGGMVDAVFTPTELAEAYRSSSLPEHLARCFCAKEALFKALGCGSAGGVSCREIELRRAAQGFALRLSGQAQQQAARRGVRHVRVDVASTGDLALATVVLEQQQDH